MDPRPSKNAPELPKLTYTETGWRKSLAAYRIAILHEHRKDDSTATLSVNAALNKLGMGKMSNIKCSIGAVANILNYMPMDWIYKMCERIDPYSDSPNTTMRIVHILAEHDIVDFVRYKNPFSGISGIGPKYARILNRAKLDILKSVKEQVEIVDMHISVPRCLRDRFAQMAKEDGTTMSELAKKVLLTYASNRPPKK